jgi:hypothetical protein
VIEVDLTLLIWPMDGDCFAIGRATNAALDARD